MEFVYHFKDNKVTAVGVTTKGNIFKGIAKCNPSDVFDHQKGIDLATLRAKIAQMKEITNNKAEFVKTFRDGLDKAERAFDKANDKFSELLWEEEYILKEGEIAEEQTEEEDDDDDDDEEMCEKCGGAICSVCDVCHDCEYEDEDEDDEDDEEEEEDEDEENCDTCKYLDQSIDDEPCDTCFNGGGTSRNYEKAE